VGDDVATGAARRLGPPVALAATLWGQRLDPLWRAAVVRAHQQSCHWALLFNGTHLRVVDAARPYSRRYLQLDLDTCFGDESSIAALCALGNLIDETDHGGLRSLVLESEREAAGVCRALRHGVFEAAASVLSALLAHRWRSDARPGGARLADAAPFEQALTVVYRVLFLLFAEARGLVPVWHPVYRDSYSIETLSRAAALDERIVGIWDALGAVCRMAHSGCRAGDLQVTPFNGRLFAPVRTPLAERRPLDDGAARRALVALTMRQAPDRAGLEPIAYRDLGVEQLGSVYESLLDYEPEIVRGRRSAAVPSGVSVRLRRGSTARKTTGTFYTPEPIARYLVRRALAPLVKDRKPEGILDLKVLDPAAGSGAFLVAACRFLARAYEDALLETGGARTGDVGPSERAAIRRLVAERCLFGVDLNPMAVQLARLSLWLTTLAGNRPLTFLDHHLQAGNSLLGAWLGDLRRAPGRRATARSTPLLDDRSADEAVRAALPVRFRLATLPCDTVEQVRSKDAWLAALSERESALSKWKRVADLWCAHWFVNDPPPPSSFGVLTDAILHGRSALPAATAERHTERAETAAAAFGFFHWELEFPEAFFGADGSRLERPGFDAVVGNPPWDMLRADTGSAVDRSQARASSAGESRFVRDSGVYQTRTGGHTNRYQLFVERAVRLARPGGRLGLVLPFGLAGDHSSAPLRRLLFEACDIDALVSFDNGLGVFPIHRSVRFVLLTATGGGSTHEVACRLGERQPAVLEGDDTRAAAWFPVTISKDLLRRISGEGLAIPELRTARDVAIVERTASLFPPLAAEAGWSATFGRELNATDDRGLFRPAGTGLPVIEGKLIEPFAVRLAGARSAIDPRDAARRLGRRHQRSRLAYRDVAAATNRMTLIAALLPPGVVSTHTVFCLRTPLRVAAQHFLCGLFNSFVLNYLARLRVGTHVTTGIVENLPIPPADYAPRAHHEIATLSKRLAIQADDTGFAWLNARVAVLYRLTHEDFEHVLSTFPLVPRAARDAALAAFDRLESLGS
jgi:hypothetical protein